MDSDFVRDAYLSLDRELGRWHARVHEGSTILAAVCDFHARLQLVAHAASSSPASSAQRAARARQFGALASDDRFIGVLRHKHEVGLHNLLAALHRTLDDLADVRARIDALTDDAWRRHGSRELPLAESTQPLWATRAGALGVERRERILVPPVAQALEDHLALGTSIGAELRLKRRILSALSVEMGAPELDELARIWSLEPHVDAELVELVRGLAWCFG
jgi:hypothetical protein